MFLCDEFGMVSESCTPYPLRHFWPRPPKKDKEIEREKGKTAGKLPYVSIYAIWSHSGSFLGHSRRIPGTYRTPTSWLHFPFSLSRIQNQAHKSLLPSPREERYKKFSSTFGFPSPSSFSGPLRRCFYCETVLVGYGKSGRADAKRREIYVCQRGGKGLVGPRERRGRNRRRYSSRLFSLLLLAILILRFLGKVGCFRRDIFIYFLAVQKRHN